jgi:hypothetical protein
MMWIFFFTTASRPALGPTHPPIHWVPGTLTLGVQQPEREADHNPQYVFTAWCLVKHGAQHLQEIIIKEASIMHVLTGYQWFEIMPVTMPTFSADWWHSLNRKAFSFTITWSCDMQNGNEHYKTSNTFPIHSVADIPINHVNWHTFTTIFHIPYSLTIDLIRAIQLPTLGTMDWCVSWGLLCCDTM